MANIAQITQLPTQEQLKYLRPLLLRLKELKGNHKLNRYFGARQFITQVLPEWLSVEQNIPDGDSVRQLQADLLNTLSDPQILYEEKWVPFWEKMQPVWNAYWDTYLQLHQKLHQMQVDGQQKIQNHVNYSKLQQRAKDFKHIQKEEKNLLALFSCDVVIQKPAEISTEAAFLDPKAFSCPTCQMSYAILKVKEKDIEGKVTAILAELDKLSPTTSPPPVPPPVSPPVVGPSKEELDSWNQYQEYHNGIDVLLRGISAQISLLQAQNKTNKTKVIQQFGKEIKKNYPKFFQEHPCSQNPGIWKTEHQACESCGLIYSSLIELESLLKSHLQELTAGEESLLPFTHEQVLKIGSESGFDALFHHQLQILSAFFANFFKNPEKTPENFKISFTITREE